jgi:K+-sensing histidine kinase KdpD
MNAVSNAAKHTPGSAVDAIAITARVETSGPQRSLVIAVTDRGTGLCGATLAQLIVEFGGDGGRVDSSDRHGIRSSGMGTPICAIVM